MSMDTPSVVTFLPPSLPPPQVKRLMQGHIEDLTSSEPTLGDTLEVGLELGEKHELFVTKCVEVSRGRSHGFLERREVFHC